MGGIEQPIGRQSGGGTDLEIVKERIDARRDELGTALKIIARIEQRMTASAVEVSELQEVLQRIGDSGRVVAILGSIVKWVEKRVWLTPFPLTYCDEVKEGIDLGAGDIRVVPQVVNRIKDGMRLPYHLRIAADEMQYGVLGTSPLEITACQIVVLVKKTGIPYHLGLPPRVAGVR